jgi:hypothetical protein
MADADFASLIEAVAESQPTRPRRATRQCSVGECDKVVYSRGFCEPHYRRFMKYGDPTSGPLPGGFVPKWIENVALHYKGDECLPWPFMRTPAGYGEVWHDGKMVVASRRICELAHGEPPSPEHEAAHECGKGHEGCVNPGHLSWKTRSENSADRVAHGTDCRGEKHGASKVTERDVLQMRELHGQFSLRELAEMFGIDRGHVWRIVRKKSWAWL